VNVVTLLQSEALAAEVAAHRCIVELAFSVSV
jgi:hypothetical protein